MSTTIQDPYTTTPTRLRIHSVPALDGTARVWFIDGADGEGHYTEACWSYDTYAAAAAALPEFVANQEAHNGVKFEWGRDRYDCWNIASAECLACGHIETDKNGLDAWNGYGDCPNCLAHKTIWTRIDGHREVIIQDDNGNMTHYQEVTPMID